MKSGVSMSQHLPFWQVLLLRHWTETQNILPPGSVWPRTNYLLSLWLSFTISEIKNFLELLRNCNFFTVWRVSKGLSVAGSVKLGSGIILSIFLQLHFVSDCYNSWNGFHCKARVYCIKLSLRLLWPRLEACSPVPHGNSICRKDSLKALE